MDFKSIFRSRGRNTVRYYLIVIALLAFLFFSNDFGLIDVQKTAIVMAVGVDKEDDVFIVTTQIAIPQSSKESKSTQAVQIVSRGKTVADAFKEINAKTGWYPKLVFCDLIILGEFSKQENVFEALDYFLRNEYLSDNCMVATCDGKAKDLLNTQALVDPSSAVAIQKVLSRHAERVGTVLPSSLRQFSIGFFGEAKSGFLPVLKTRPQQEKISGENTEQENTPKKKESASGGSEKNQGGGSDASQGGNQKSSEQDKPVFSASETALFVEGKWVDTFLDNETFAFATIYSKLQLASYTVEQNGEFCTLNVRNNQPKISLKIGDNERVFVKVDLALTAGISDYSKSQDLSNLADAGDAPKAIYGLAEKKLKAELTQVFEKCRASGCDLFEIQSRLQRREKDGFYRVNNDALDGAILEVNVRFTDVR